MITGDVDKGHALLVKHTSLLRYRDNRAAASGETIPAAAAQP
jgi:hypothetical protein